MTRQHRRSQGNQETSKLEALNVQDVRGQGHPDSRHQPFDLEATAVAQQETVRFFTLVSPE